MKSPPETISIAAPAKINLFLHIGEKRTDGFHAVRSLVVFACVGDVLDFAPSDTLALFVDGPFAAGLGAGDNLVLRAARALAERVKCEARVKIALTKNLPVASGIGGGSSDAAAALRGLARLWNLGLSPQMLAEIAASIGSDVSVCLAVKPAWMEGRGEIVTPLAAMPPFAMLLVNPGVAVPTRDVFANLGARSGKISTRPERFEDTANLLRFLETTTNDLEAPARMLCPVIGEVLEALRTLPGALFARMSGSGATCFAIFADNTCARRGADLLRAQHPGWWIAPTTTGGTGMAAPETCATDIGPVL